MAKKSTTITYSILEFTEYPGPRYESQGEDSGEIFYKDELKPRFQQILDQSLAGDSVVLEVNLDNTAGYASSFLDEAFGNLAYDYGEDVVKNHLVIVSNQEPDWIEIIWNETIPEWHKKKLKKTPRKPNLN